MRITDINCLAREKNNAKVGMIVTAVNGHRITCSWFDVDTNKIKSAEFDMDDLEKIFLLSDDKPLFDAENYYRELNRSNGK